MKKVDKKKFIVVCLLTGNRYIQLCLPILEYGPGAILYWPRGQSAAAARGWLAQSDRIII
jgi:hypothetical protein